MNSSVSSAPATASPTAQDRRQLPLFFRRPELLEAGKHGDLQLADKWDYSFAAGTLAIPLTVAEFREAAVTFPIVFGGGANPMPVALTSLQPERNLFVTDGRWQPGTYVPAYVRRYPFLAVKVREKPDDYGLVADVESNLLERADGGPEKRRLFADGKPTALAERTLRFCLAFEIEAERTRRFVRALVDAKAIGDSHVSVAGADGKRTEFHGFSAIEADAIRKAPDETLSSWRRDGWLEPIVLAQWSQRNWSRLASGTASLRPAAAPMAFEASAVM
jgi:hypothetical protein